MSVDIILQNPYFARAYRSAVEVEGGVQHVDVQEELMVRLDARRLVVVGRVAVGGEADDGAERALPPGAQLAAQLVAGGRSAICGAATGPRSTASA